VSGVKLIVKLENLENGGFKGGLRYWADKGNNWHKRLALSKLIRALDRAVDEPNKQYQDMLREFGEKNKNGDWYVNPPSLTKEEAAAWDEQIKKWRETTVDVEVDAILMKEDKLLIQLPKDVLDRFLFVFVDALSENAIFEEAAESKEDEVARLKKERDEALKKAEAQA
jgi:hypothetical protein